MTQIIVMVSLLPRTRHPGMQSQVSLRHHITTNKASRDDRIPVELFQILKDDAVKVLHSVCQQIWKTQQWPRDLKMSVFIPIPKKGNAKQCSNYCITAHMLARLRSKSLKTGFSSMWTESFQMWKLLSCVLFFATPWTVAHQAPLSREFSRQEHWSGLPFPSPC